MLSMTGFGKSEAKLNEFCTIAVELSSVNRKQLEIRAALPPELTRLEYRARRIIGEKISRGSVQLRISLLSGDGDGLPASINTELLDRLISAAAAARTRHGLGADVAVEQLMHIPGVVNSNASPDFDTAETETAFDAAVAGAVDACNQMRRTEGAALREDFIQRLEKLSHLLDRIEPLVADMADSIKTRLLEKLSVEDIPVAAEDDRLLKEVLFFADRADVAEEITRLRSHFAQMQGFLDADQPCGRSMDFLMQEFFREITTLGNKAGFAAVSPLVVAFKSELEKIREQVQNVE
ncbi:MAG: YicC family protein [Victivallaceae bacterium]|nr:YicC family protein [Victivallaceae bacterium]